MDAAPNRNRRRATPKLTLANKLGSRWTGCISTECALFPTAHNAMKTLRPGALARLPFKRMQAYIRA